MHELRGSWLRHEQNVFAERAEALQITSIDRVRSPFGSALYIFRDTKVASYSGIVDSTIYRKALAGESQEAVNTLTERLS